MVDTGSRSSKKVENLFLQDCFACADGFPLAPIMQDVIDAEFASSHTVISVLHRFRHIDRFDRVALLKGGKIVECDSPQVLLARNSEFRKLYMSLEKH